MKKLFVITAILLHGPALADVVVPTQTIRANTMLGPQDLTVKSGHIPGAFDRVSALIGQETRVTLYAGRPIRPNDVGPPAVVDRNQLVQLVYAHNGLSILTEARALGRGGVGDRIRVMNLTSRTQVTGTIHADGSVHVQP